MTVYFIRHGQTPGNKEGFHQGWTEIELNTKGQKQIGQTKKTVEGMKFDRVFCSDLKRTRQSAGIIFGSGIEDTDIDFIEYLPVLREINNTCFAGKTMRELEEKYGEQYLHDRRRFDYSKYGGETGPELAVRTEMFLDMLADIPEKENGEETRIAVVTHGGFLSALASHLMGGVPGAWRISMSNGAISVISRREAEYEGETKCGWRIEQWNYTPKLYM